MGWGEKQTALPDGSAVVFSFLTASSERDVVEVGRTIVVGALLRAHVAATLVVLVAATTAAVEAQGRVIAAQARYDDLVLAQARGLEGASGVTSETVAALRAHGARATPGRALAWVELEADRTMLAHGLRVRFWPGGEEPVTLAAAHAHGARVDWVI